MSGNRFCCCGSKARYWTGTANCPMRVHIVEKSAFNCFVGLKETYMVQLAHGLKVHEILLRDQLATWGNLHLLTMMKFCYNMKKRRVIRNEIMIFHNQPQPRAQNPHPYNEEMWKKIKLQHKYNKVLFALVHWWKPIDGPCAPRVG